MAKRKMTGGEAVIAALEAWGVEVAFGIPGGHNLAVYDALAKGTSIRHILGRHEQGLAFMADGYARACGKPGVVLVTSGPAVANLACAMGGATTDISPVLAIASTVRTDMVGKSRGGLHDCCEAIDIMRPVTRMARRAMSVQEIPQFIHELMQELTLGRPGGAFLEIPCDVMGAVDELEITPPAAGARKHPDARLIDQAIALLADAKKPVIIAGTGVVISGAEAEVAELAERIDAAVVTTTLGRGILPSDHPRSVMPDGAMVTAVSDYVESADVVLAVGTMFKQENTADWKAGFSGKLIHIDIDPEELGRSYQPHLGITADAKAALQAIINGLPKKNKDNGDWVADGKAAEADRIAKRWEGRPSGMVALDILRKSVPEDTILSCDRCNLGYWAYRCLPVYEPRTFFYPMGYGGLGGALPQAFGAKVARPDKPVVCVIGDGGFQFTATELAVAVQDNIPVTIVLCNNRAYGAIRANQDRNFGGRRFGSDLLNPDFPTLFKAYGIKSTLVDTLDAFGPALARGIASNELNMIELTVEIADP